MSQFGSSYPGVLMRCTVVPIPARAGRESWMTLSKVEATFCERELGELVRTSSGVEIALIATGDGFEVACATRGRTLDAARVAGLASSVLALGRAMARELDLKASRSAVMEADGGLVLLFVVPCQRADLILAAVASKDTTMGMCLVDVRRCAEEIARRLDLGYSGKGRLAVAEKSEKPV
jgi:predicted regulator of Ras-like GTPase activity (Roadblock/LC7/MglB family)